MTADTIHTCSCSCERPECIRAQRDELAAWLTCIRAQRDELAAWLMLCFDLSPAQKEGAIREHLIRLGWTPPDGHALSRPAEQRAVDVGALRAERDALKAENARLREALDELLEALQAIVDEVSDGLIPYSSDSYLPAHLVERARAALAKENSND